MILAKVLNKIYKEDGIILVDPQKQKYIIGNPRPNKPITLKLLKENLKYKLLIDPEFFSLKPIWPTKLKLKTLHYTSF